MDELIEALGILRQYPGGEAAPGVSRDPYSEAAWLRVDVAPGLVSPEDLARLKDLGFTPWRESFFSVLDEGLT